MPYRLYRESIPEPPVPLSDMTGEQLLQYTEVRGELTWLGDYPDLNVAVDHHQDDAVLQLANNGGDWTHVSHLIVGPGLQGPETEHWYYCHLGPDRDIPRVDPDKQLVATLVDTRLWLEAVRECSALPPETDRP